MCHASRIRRLNPPCRPQAHPRASSRALRLQCHSRPPRQPLPPAPPRAATAPGARCSEVDGYVVEGVGTCKRGLKSSRGVLCGKILPHLRSSRFLPLLQKSSSPCLREGLPPTPLDLTAVCHARAARRVHGGGGGGIPGFSRRHSASQPGEWPAGCQGQ